MKVSTKGRYALRIMIDLAVNCTGNFIPSKEISKRQDISIKYLEQIISSLHRMGYLKSARGINGGYKLAKEPKDYTVGDILRATEGSLAPITCLEDEENQCPRNCNCTTLNFWEGLNKLINDYVDKHTIEDLIANNIDTL